MAYIERIRELLPNQTDPDYIREKTESGWKLVAIEWEREVDEPAAAPAREEVPFGYRVSDDCLHLAEEPNEKAAMTLALQLVVQDTPLTMVAGELNRNGYLTRHGGPWTPAAVFDLLPGLIDAAPRIFTTAEWPERRKAASSFAN